MTHTTPARHSLCQRPGARSVGDAFTLFEVAISLLIITFGVVSILMLFPAGLKRIQINRARIYSAAIASQLIDTFAQTNSTAYGIDYESLYPWENIVDRRVNHPDLEARCSFQRAGLVPLPLDIARRIDSDGDEIAHILDDGGYIYYLQPQTMSIWRNDIAPNPPPQDLQRLIVGISGAAQHNASFSLPMKRWPYQWAVPSSPMPFLSGIYALRLPLPPIDPISGGGIPYPASLWYWRPPELTDFFTVSIHPGRISMHIPLYDSSRGTVFNYHALFEPIVSSPSSDPSDHKPLPTNPTPFWPANYDSHAVFNAAMTYLGMPLGSGDAIAAINQIDPSHTLLRGSTSVSYIYKNQSAVIAENAYLGAYIRQCLLFANKAFKGAGITTSAQLRTLITPPSSKDPVTGNWYWWDQPTPVTRRSYLDQWILSHNPTLSPLVAQERSARAVMALNYLTHAMICLTARFPSAVIGGSDRFITHHNDFPASNALVSLDDNAVAGDKNNLPLDLTKVFGATLYNALNTDLLSKITGSATSNTSYNTDGTSGLMQPITASDIDIFDGAFGPGSIVNQSGLIALHHQCLRHYYHFCARYPYNWMVPRPMAQSLMMDYPLLELDMFRPVMTGPVLGSTGLQSFGTINGQAQQAAQWKYMAPTTIDTLATDPSHVDWDPSGSGTRGGRFGYSRTYPEWDIGGSSASASFFSENGPPGSNPADTHYTMLNAFKPSERCRQLKFWAVDWQQYEDFETAPSAPVEASRYPLVNPVAIPWNRSGTPANRTMDVRMQMVQTLNTGDTGTGGNTNFDKICNAHNSILYNPEHATLFIKPMTSFATGTDVTLSVMSKHLFPAPDYGPPQTKVNTAGSPPGIPGWDPDMAANLGYCEQVYNGLFGADRNCNHQLDRGPLKKHVRIRAQSISSYIFYDQRIHGQFR